MIRRALLLALLCVCVLGKRPSARAGDDEPASPPPTRIALPHPVPDETNHFGLYDGREKVGHGLLGLAWRRVDGVPVYESRSGFAASVPGLDVAFASLDAFRGTVPFELLRSEEMQRDADGERSVGVRRVADRRYRAQIEERGGTRAVELEDVDYTLADRLTWIHWIQRGPAVGDAITVRELDLSEQRLDEFTYRVTGIAERPVLGVRVRVYGLTMRSKLRGALGVGLADAEGRLLEAPFAGRLVMRLEPEAQAVDRRYASPLFGFGRVPVNEGLGEPRTVTRMVVALYGREAKAVPDATRQAVRLDDASGDLLLTVGGDAGTSAAVSAAEEEAALAEDEDHPTSDDAVRAVARAAVGDVTSRAARVAALVGFVSAFVRDANVPAETPVRTLLRTHKGDGTEHARLFTTLARALGIPCREVVGLVYLGDDELAFAPHVWCEVVLDGRWVEVDPTWDEVHLSATHVTLSRGSADWVPAAAHIRGLQVERREIRRTDPGR